MWDARRPSRTDVAMALFLVVLEVSGFGQDPGLSPGSRALELVLPLALLARTVAPAAVAAAFLGASAASAVLGTHRLDSGATVVALVVAVYACAAYQPLPRAATVLGLWFASAAMDGVAGRTDGTDVAFACVILTCAFAPGVVARRLRLTATESRAAAADAAGREVARAEQAVTDERARIARELHDVVAHAVSIVVVQAAAADAVLECDPERAHAALAAVQGAGRTAIAELARMLDLLRGTPADRLAPLPTLARLPELVQDAQLAGVRVALQFQDPVPPLPPAVELCAFRVVQEALTNVAKHVQQADVRVVLGCRAGELDVLVEDDGGSGAVAGGGTGLGLVGLRERVSVFGGHLEAGCRPGGGFRVHAVVPVPGPT